jgi:hypothetical protein
LVLGRPSGHYLHIKISGIQTEIYTRESGMKTLEEKQIEREEAFVMFCALAMKAAIVAAAVSLWVNHA